MGRGRDRRYGFQSSLGVCVARLREACDRGENCLIQRYLGARKVCTQVKIMLLMGRHYLRLQIAARIWGVLSLKIK